MGFLVNVHAITRMIVTQTKPFLQIYTLPLQIHPLRPLWRYGTPAAFVKDSWKAAGPFLTIGWPQDTTGLEDGCINDEQFLDLCSSIDAARFRLLLHRLDTFHEGLLACVFDTLDRVQHMFWGRDPHLLETWYERLDDMVGQISARVFQTNGKPGAKTARMLIVSDHGFHRFRL